MSDNGDGELPDTRFAMAIMDHMRTLTKSLGR
jgi:hypothetical protein